MPDREDRGLSFLARMGLTLPMIVILIGNAAFVGGWAMVLDSQVDRVVVDSTDHGRRLYAVELKQAVMDNNYVNLRELVNELRRQAGLRTPPTLFEREP